MGGTDGQPKTQCFHRPQNCADAEAQKPTTGYSDEEFTGISEARYIKISGATLEPTAAAHEPGESPAFVPESSAQPRGAGCSLQKKGTWIRVEASVKEKAPNSYFVIADYPGWFRGVRRKLELF